MNSLIEEIEDNNPLYDTVISINELTNINIDIAKGIFDTFTKKMIIINSKFSDRRWQFCDEYSNVGMVFDISEFTYKKYYESILGYGLNECLNYIKTYLMLQMGKMVLSSLRMVSNDIQKVLNTSMGKLHIDSIVLSNPNKVIDFFDILPAIDFEKKEILMDLLINIAELKYMRNATNRRELAEFQSYFQFDKYLNQYWESNITVEERLFFYPIYLWWKITAIIPLRPREFLLTPRDCLSVVEDKYFITLQRNTLKGSDKKIHYNIIQDYRKVTYQVPKSLYQTIANYIELTNFHTNNVIKTLFRTDAHYLYFEQNTRVNNRFYTYVNLSTCLKTFYRDILNKGYHLKILSKNDMEHNDYDNSIEYINLGDTRHIAMINIISEGGSPTIAMQLAGHSDIDISSHYFSNIKNMIECKTYLKYKELTTGQYKLTYGMNHYQTFLNENYTDLGNGQRCYSTKFMNGDISDCRNVISEASEIGDCHYCTYFRKNNIEYFIYDEKIYKSMIVMKISKKLF